MPELPEVEAIARTLRPLVRGQRIRCVHVFHPIIVRPQAAAYLADLAQGQRVNDVRRHGKFLFLVLDRGLVEMHFKFDGHLIWFSNAKELLKRANQDVEQVSNKKNVRVHVDLAFELGKGVLAFADQRHLGRVHFWKTKAECKPLGRLGVDAMSGEFTPDFLRSRLATSSKPLKEFLLDQTKLSGVGNIYSSEALWHAKLNPWRRAHLLNTAEAAKLHKAIVSVLGRALECCLHPAPQFRDPDWWFQGIESILRVYQRKDLPCRRCKRLIQRKEQGGRSTYYCPHCQK
jgi:formamidopyrimidine-DNA glycosylase